MTIQTIIHLCFWATVMIIFILSWLLIWKWNKEDNQFYPPDKSNKKKDRR